MYTKVEQDASKKSGGAIKKINERYKFLSVTYDLNILKYEIFASLISILFLGLMIALQYKTPFVDPIGRQKGIFLTVQIGVAIFSIILMGIIARHTKKKDSMLRNFLLYSTLFLILILGEGVFLGNFAKQFGEAQFRTYYEEYEAEDNTNNRTQLSISSTGVTSSTAKDEYVKTSKKAFSNFILRAILLITLQLIILGFVFYILYKLMRTTARIAAPAKNVAT